MQEAKVGSMKIKAPEQHLSSTWQLLVPIGVSCALGIVRIGMKCVCRSRRPPGAPPDPPFLRAPQEAPCGPGRFDGGPHPHWPRPRVLYDIQELRRLRAGDSQRHVDPLTRPHAPCPPPCRRSACLILLELAPPLCHAVGDEAELRVVGELSVSPRRLRGPNHRLRRRGRIRHVGGWAHVTAVAARLRATTATPDRV